MQYSPSVARLVKAKETVYMVKLASMRTASVRVCACARVPCRAVPCFPFYSFCCRAATSSKRSRSPAALCVRSVACSKRPAALAPSTRAPPDMPQLPCVGG
ncbi:hypothetical protein PVAP13_3NG080002 [Panicum virgatum]|uniref:Uncharacterized protein n=1 Tax=Panicum virgatum TaxID=38727 RepID=A0A8T0U297_PANVG|nr:hypothetical protein PVAP13_3NG080002 [Panicum virgatum]